MRRRPHPVHPLSSLREDLSRSAENLPDLVGLHYDGSTSPPEGIGADQHNTPGTAAEVRPYIEDNYGLVGYSDASWRSKLNDYSSYGYVVYLFGGVVSFASKFLKVVAMSSAEAEYAAASQTCLRRRCV